MLNALVWNAGHGGVVFAIAAALIVVAAAVGYLVGPRGRAPRRAGIAGLVAAALIVVVGEVAMSSARGALEAFRSSPGGDVSGLTSVVVASFSPLRRRDALDAFRDALDARADPDPERFQARSAFRLARGDADGLATLGIEQGSQAVASLIAARTGNYRLAARGFYLGGELGQASDMWSKAGEGGSVDELRLGLVAHVASGALGRAESSARALAKALAADPKAAARAAAATCLAEALAAKQAADGKPRRVADGKPELSVACACLDADLADGDDRIARLSERTIVGDDAPRAWLDLLRAEASPTHDGVPPPAWSSAPAAFAVPERTIEDALPAIERGLGDTIERVSAPPSASRIHAALRAGLLAELEGDHDAAARLAKVATTESEELLRLAVLAADSAPPPPPLAAAAAQARSLESLLATVRLDAGAGELTGSGGRDSAWLLAARLGSADAPPPPEGAGEAWVPLRTGKWGELASGLRLRTLTDGTWLRFADPAARKTPPTGAPELLAQVRFGRRVGGTPRLLELLVRSRNLADAARRLGDKDAAVTDAQRADSLAKALARRDVAVLLAVAERL